VICEESWPDRSPRLTPTFYFGDGFHDSDSVRDASTEAAGSVECVVVYLMTVNIIC